MKKQRLSERLMIEKVGIALAICLVFLLNVQFLNAQNSTINVRGVVTDGSGEPIIGASVVQKGNTSRGTDLTGGSYWYKRCTTYNVFNRPYGKGQQGSQAFEYKVNKHNIFWPVPNSAITANNKADLRQNFGYDGYSDQIPMWTNWEEAVADEGGSN
jgi:hypothetical protein